MKKVVAAALLLMSIAVPFVGVSAAETKTEAPKTVAVTAQQQGVKKQTIVLPKKTTNWSKIKQMFM